jgi:predicted nucleotidyltransferase
VDTQERIKTAVANVLEQDQRLVFAYIYGSFSRAEAFRDIDVGVYLRDPVLRIAKVNLQSTW